MADVLPCSTATATAAHRLLLFVSGNSQYADNAIRDVRALCRHPAVGECELRVIDIARDPEAAGAYDVIVTPLLVRESPLPIRRVSGNLSDPERVLHALGIPVRDPAPLRILKTA